MQLPLEIVQAQIPLFHTTAASARMTPEKKSDNGASMIICNVSSILLVLYWHPNVACYVIRLLLENSSFITANYKPASVQGTALPKLY